MKKLYLSALSSLTKLKVLVSLSVIAGILAASILTSMPNVQDIRYLAVIGLILLVSVTVCWLIDRAFRPFYAANRAIEGAVDSDSLEVLPVGGRDPAGQLLQNFNRQILHRQHAENRLARVNNLFDALKHIKQDVANSKDEVQLLNQVCHNLVALTGITMAWIGKTDADTLQIEPIARNGLGLSYLQSIYVSARADIPEGRGPTGTAYREHRPVVINDYQAGKITKPWQKLIKDYGWQSAGAFPIGCDGKSFAVLTVYHPSLGVFEPEFIELLMEVVGHTGFALTKFDATAESKIENISLSQADFDYPALSTPLADV